jgi:hypothetical protein
MMSLKFLTLSALIVTALSVGAEASDTLSVVDFLPDGYVSDGRVSYQREIQRAIDTAADEHRPLVVPPLWFLVDESGIQLRSGTHALDARRRVCAR